MSQPLIILAAGGHAKVLIEALRQSDRALIGLTDTDSAKHGQEVLGIPVIGDDDALATHPPDQVELVTGIGGIETAQPRADLFERFIARGYRFATVVHPSAVIATDVVLPEGCQIMAGAVIQPGCQLGRNCLINTNATLDHDCRLGDHSHLAPGVSFSGSITVGPRTHIGTGTSAIHGVSIGADCLIGAGSVIVRDIPDGSKAYGVPAKPIE